MDFVPQFNCFSKVVSNDFCKPIRIRAKSCRWLITIALSNNTFIFSGNFLLSVFKTIIPQAILWRIFFTSPSNFSLLSIITPRYFTLSDSAILSLSTFKTVVVNLFLVLNTMYFVFCLFTTNRDLAEKSLIFEMLCSSFVFDDISSVSDVQREVSSAYWTTGNPFLQSC